MNLLNFSECNKKLYQYNVLIKFSVGDKLNNIKIQNHLSLYYSFSYNFIIYPESDYNY